jgi:hypothetical protein
MVELLEEPISEKYGYAPKRQSLQLQYVFLMAGQRCFLFLVF